MMTREERNRVYEETCALVRNRNTTTLQLADKVEEINKASQDAESVVVSYGLMLAVFVDSLPEFVLANPDVMNIPPEMTVQIGEGAPGLTSMRMVVAAAHGDTAMIRDLGITAVRNGAAFANAVFNNLFVQMVSGWHVGCPGCPSCPADRMTGVSN